MSSISKNYIAEIKQILATARQKSYTAVNFAMVEAYWLIGKRIVEDIWHTLCAKLTWSHIRLAMRVSDKNAQTYYLKEAAENNFQTSKQTIIKNVSYSIHSRSRRQ